MRKLAPVAGLLLTLLSTWVLSRNPKHANGGTAAPLPVSATRVIRADLTRTITLAAEFQPYQEVELHAKVAGYVRSIRVDVGYHVKAGETIAVLEIPELSDDLKKAAAATRAAQEDMKRAQAQHEEVHLANQRLLQVAKERPNLVAQQDIDAATAADLGAEAGLASARQRIEESQANEGRMQTMLAYGTITAPFDGVVTKRFADTGALIQAGTASSTQALPVVTLAEDRLLRLLFPVPESIVPFIKEGTPVDVEVPALHRIFKGKVARYSGQVERATRTMHTEVDVPNPDLRLTPGMYASATIALEERRNALCLPVQALVGSSVFVVGEGDRVVKREVKVGLETPERIEVLDGLGEGDLVLVGSRGQVQPGDRVLPKIQGGEPGKAEGHS